MYKTKPVEVISVTDLRNAKENDKVESMKFTSWNRAKAHILWFCQPGEYLIASQNDEHVYRFINKG